MKDKKEKVYLPSSIKNIETKMRNNTKDIIKDAHNSKKIIRMALSFLFMRVKI